MAEALSDELLLVVFEKLGSTRSLIRCGAVCKQWHRLHTEVTSLCVTTNEEWMLVSKFPKLVGLRLRYPAISICQVLEDVVSHRLEYMTMHLMALYDVEFLFSSYTCFSKLEELLIWSQTALYNWWGLSNCTFPRLKVCILSGMASPWIQDLLDASPELLRLELTCNGWGNKELMASGSIGTTTGRKLAIKSAKLKALALFGILWEHVEVDCPQLDTLKVEGVKRLVLRSSATQLYSVQLFSPGCNLDLKQGVKSNYFFFEEPQLASSGKWTSRELVRCFENSGIFNAVQHVSLEMPTVVEFWTPTEPELKGARCISFFDIAKISCKEKDSVVENWWTLNEFCVGQDLESLDLGSLVLGVIIGEEDRDTCMQLRSLLVNNSDRLGTVVVFSEMELSRAIKRMLSIEGVAFQFKTGAFKTDVVKEILTLELHAVQARMET